MGELLFGFYLVVAILWFLIACFVKNYQEINVLDLIAESLLWPIIGLIYLRRAAIRVLSKTKEDE